MPLPILVINRDAAMEQGGKPGPVERFRNVDRIEGFDLIEQEAAVAIRAGEQGFAGKRIEREGASGQGFGAGSMTQRSSAPASRRRRISTCALERSAALSSKLGFSVVAPTSVTVPSSTNGRKLSC